MFGSCDEGDEHLQTLPDEAMGERETYPLSSSGWPNNQIDVRN